MVSVASTTVGLVGSASASTICRVAESYLPLALVTPSLEPVVVFQ